MAAWLGVYIAPSLLEMMYHACNTPGIQPRILKQTLIQKSAAQPRFKKTETGGRKMARKYRQTSPVEDGWDIIALEE